MPPLSFAFHTLAPPPLHLQQRNDVTTYQRNNKPYHGLRAERVASVVAHLANSAPSKRLRLLALCTHMCDASQSQQYTKKQFARFADVVNAVRRAGVLPPMLHLENSEVMVMVMVMVMVLFLESRSLGVDEGPS